MTERGEGKPKVGEEGNAQMLTVSHQVRNRPDHQRTAEEMLPRARRASAMGDLGETTLNYFYHPLGIQCDKQCLPLLAGLSVLSHKLGTRSLLCS